MRRDAANVWRGLTVFVGGACLCPPAASKSTADAEEMRRREAWAEKVPPEPDGSMQASQVKVLMGDHKVTRRFGSGARAGHSTAQRATAAWTELPLLASLCLPNTLTLCSSSRVSCDTPCCTHRLAPSLRCIALAATDCVVGWLGD